MFPPSDDLFGREPGPLVNPPDATRNPKFDLGLPSLSRFPLGTGELPSQWVWVLSGGGAKGSFQVGAALYLFQSLSLRPKGLAGTSVGSLNALALAEVSEAGLYKLRDMWLGMRNRHDMYSFTAKMAEIDRLESFAESGLSLRGIIDGTDNPSVDLQQLIASIPFSNMSAGMFVFLNVLTLGIIGDITLDKIKQVVGDVKRALTIVAEEAKGIYSFAPLKRQMVETVSPALHRVPFRLVSISLEDKHAYAVNEQGRLFRSPDPTRVEPMVEIGRLAPIPTSLDERRSPGNQRLKIWLETGFGDGRAVDPAADVLIQGALASSSIPIINPPFPIEYITTDRARTSLSLYDGGVRETLPIRAGLDVLALLRSPGASKKGLIVITAGAVSPRPEDALWGPQLEPLLDAQTQTIPAATSWTLDVLTDEVEASELVFVRSALPAGTEVLEILPSVAIGSSANLDPGLVQLGLSYGYMTAFDKVMQRKQQLNDNEYRHDLWSSTNEIVQTRYLVWTLEKSGSCLLAEYPGLGRLRPDIPKTWLFKRGIVRQIRNLKRNILGATEERARAHGTNSHPNLHDLSRFSVSNFNHPVDVWRHWERHATRPSRDPSRSSVPDGPGISREHGGRLVTQDFARFDTPWSRQWEFEIRQPTRAELELLLAAVAGAKLSGIGVTVNVAGRLVTNILGEFAFFERYGFWACLIDISTVEAQTAPVSTGLERSPDYCLVQFEGYVFDPALPQPRGTKPLRNFWSAPLNDNWATSGPPPDGYEDGGLLGYVFDDRPSSPLTVPLFTWWSGGFLDHMTTTDFRFVLGNPYAEARPMDTTIEPDYGGAELQGFVFDPRARRPSGTVPIYRWFSPSRGDNAIPAGAVWRAEYGFAS